MYDDIFPLHHKEFLARVRIVVNEILMSREEVMKMRESHQKNNNQKTNALEYHILKYRRN